MISAAFLAISSFLSSYSAVDSSKSATINEDYYYHNIKEQFNNVVSSSSCPELAEKLKEFKYFSEKSVGELGYFLLINYTIVSCPPKDVRMGIIIGSDKMVIYENINASEAIPGMD
jgi:hypothetical protein